MEKALWNSPQFLRMLRVLGHNSRSPALLDEQSEFVMRRCTHNGEMAPEQAEWSTVRQARVQLQLYHPASLQFQADNFSELPFPLLQNDTNTSTSGGSL